MHGAAATRRRTSSSSVGVAAVRLATMRMRLGPAAGMVGPSSGRTWPDRRTPPTRAEALQAALRRDGDGYAAGGRGGGVAVGHAEDAALGVRTLSRAS